MSNAPTLVDELALEVLDLCSGYGDTQVLRGVGLQVRRGAITVLLGPNGAGKSTLLRTVSGLVPVAGGTIRMLGADVTGLSAHRRAGAGLCHIPEGRGVFRRLTVRENLAMQASAATRHEALERAVEAFPILGRRLDQEAGTMSGGEQQMLAMAAAYVRNPTLILVDEASLGLAPIVVDEIFAFLEARTQAGASLLLVDQFVHRALAMATDAYVLNHGRITFAGSAEELREGDDLFERYARS